MSVLVKESEDVLRFAVRFWRPHVGIMALSAFLTLFSTSLHIAIPGVAREIANFDDNVTRLSDAEWNWTTEIVSFPPGLVKRCAFLVAVILTYHTSSFLAHRTAYYTGQRVHNTILETVLVAVLRTTHPDRLGSVSPVKLAQVILSSARTSAEVIGGILTDVLSSVCAAVTLLVMLLYMSAKLTVTIGAILLTSQLILLSKRRLQQSRNKELALAESDVQAFTTNALHRSATVRVFHAESLILTRLREHLELLSVINADVVTSIHGQTGFSSAVTGVLFVLVLGMTNRYRQRGELDMVDIAVYYMLLYQFIQCLLHLVHECQKTHSLLERLHTLQRLTSWYEVDEIVRMQLLDPNGAVVSKGLPPEEPASDRRMTISLKNVTYKYPEIPSFLSETTEKEKDFMTDEDAPPVDDHKQNGVRDLSLQIRPGVITALYGPSGCGKSTCLRLLAGLLQAQEGTVSTDQTVALLEQQQAVLLGSVAENILMVDTGSLPSKDAAKAREEVGNAMRQSGCHTFLTDPFNTLIHSADKAQFSGGQLQQICMARLFARKECTLLLLDEPTTGLDGTSVDHLLTTLKELNTSLKKTIVVATHDTRLTTIAHDVIDFRDHQSPKESKAN